MSSAVIMGLAVFENPRVLEGKTLLFDTQFYLGPGQSLVGAFRYFNGLDLAFGEVGQYFVYANVNLTVSFLPKIAHTTST